VALYIDSADRAHVEELLAVGVFTGVTTNPTILERAGVPQDSQPEIYRWAAAAGAQEIFFQARGDDESTLVRAGVALAALGPRVIVKLPATRAGIAATAELASRGLRTLVTAVYHPAQALLARAAGAAFIAPYVGRMTDQGRDGLLNSAKMAQTLEGSDCRVIAASLRSLDDVAALAAAGVPDFTLSAPLCDALLADDLTVAAAQAFELAGT
jgi:TalC/MipB family fructose-6-phosphate aldolase